MTKMQLKAMYMYGWNAHESACIDAGNMAIVSSKIMDKEFEELILRPYIAELITEEDKDG
ncbi:MAG: hypothetical protein ABIN01_06065 [Ferruginibacter sp.]